MPGGAVSGFDAEFALFAVGVTPVPEAWLVVEDAVTAVLEAVGPGRPASYLNFAERRRSGRLSVRRGGARAAARGQAAYDPDDVIRSNHPVEPGLTVTSGRAP